MRKTTRLLTLLGTLCLASTSMLPAETMGTNPRPRPAFLTPTMEGVATAFILLLTGH